MRLKGAEAVLIPTFGQKDEINRVLMRTRAYENGFFAVFNHPQQALVTDPDGDVLLDVMGDVEGVFCQDIDLARVQNKNLVVTASKLALYRPYAKKWKLAERWHKKPGELPRGWPDTQAAKPLGEEKAKQLL